MGMGTDNPNYKDRYSSKQVLGSAYAKVEKDYIVVGGVTFTALMQNDKEKLGFYVGRK